MVNSKKVIAALGVVAGLGVAMLPLTSYAIDNTNRTEGYVVRVGVADTLSIESVTELWTTEDTGFGTTAGGDKYIAVAQGESNTSSFAHIVKVNGSTRADYALSMYGIGANDGEATDLTHTTKADKITSTAAGKSALDKGTWGAKVSEKLTAAPTKIEDDTFGDTFLPIGTAAAKTELHAASGTHDKEYNDFYAVLYGVSAREDQLAGIYEGKVVYYVTATNSL